MKKLIVLVIILAASATAVGCVDCKNFIPAVNPTLVPTVGPTPQASMPGTATAEPSAGALPLNFKEYDVGVAPYAPMGTTGVLVSHPTYYMRDDLEMPLPPEKGLKPAHHGLIHKLEFWNPTEENHTVYVNYFPSAIIERYDGEGRFVSAQQMFYDDRLNSFFSVFDVEPHGRRTVYVYAYINDEDWEKYHGQFSVGGLTITMPTGYY